MDDEIPAQRPDHKESNDPGEDRPGRFYCANVRVVHTPDCGGVLFRHGKRWLIKDWLS